MKAFQIKPTLATPAIGYDANLNTFSIIGNSIPENVNGFYGQVFTWLKDNIGQLPNGCTFKFSLPYMSSSSLKAIFFILKIVEEECRGHRGFTVEWYVEDDDESMIETGETFAEALQLDIRLMPGLLGAVA